MTGHKREAEWRLSRRLAWRLAAVMTAAVVLAAGAVVWRTLATIRSLDDAALQSQARLVAAQLVAGPHGVAQLHLPPELQAAFNASDAQSLYVVYDRGGAPLLASDAAAPAALAPFLPAPPDQGIFRVPPSTVYPDGLIGVVIRVDPWRVVVAQAHEQQQVLVTTLLREFLFSALWLLAPIGLACVATAVLTIRHGLRPLRDASAAAVRIGPAQPALRLPDAGLPGELKPLVGAVNGALARLGQALETQRRFFADAAHALRTPLAVLIARIEALPTAAEAEALLADADRMRRLVDQMLTLARVEGRPLDVSGPLDLHEAAVAAISTLAPLAIGGGIELALVADRKLPPLRGNQAALVLAIENLVDNALAHAPPGTLVEVELTPPATLRVLDRGPGVPKAERAAIFGRFHGRRSRGAGLGLAIVAEIVAAHGGTVHVQARGDGGAVFVIALPTPSAR